LEVLIVGASLGGAAAALAAARNGAKVTLLEETQWPGGQLTVQGVCTPDEQQHVETFGSTRSYMQLRDAIRSHYRTNFRLSEAGASAKYLNPGMCWVSRIAVEPEVGATLLKEMLLPYQEAGALTVLYGARALAVAVQDYDDGSRRITSVTASLADGAVQTFEPDFVLDATDTGDLLPLCGEEGIDWITGAEGHEQTNEPDAPNLPQPQWVQPLTFPFAIDWSPETAETNVIDPPEDYAILKAEQRYHVIHGAITGLFAGSMPWWRYRRTLAKACFADSRIPSDLAMINTAGNDYYGGNIIGENPKTGITVTDREASIQLDRARRVSLGYLYWLQTECERTQEDLDAAPGDLCAFAIHKGKGYPEFRLRRDVFGTEDGCSIKPYIRESRRILANSTVREQEIVVKDFMGNLCRGEQARSAFRSDSVGIGHYALDIHPNGHGEPNHYVATRPFQIPLGTLIPRRIVNLLPACKNAGLTHLTNGAYRLHPIEWNIGESAGCLAAFCLLQRLLPEQVSNSGELTLEFQRHLTSQGIALHWYIDVPSSDPAFAAVQWLAARLGPVSHAGSVTDLRFRPEELICPRTWSFWRRASGLAPDNANDVSKLTRKDAVLKIYEEAATAGTGRHITK